MPFCCSASAISEPTPPAPGRTGASSASSARSNRTLDRLAADSLEALNGALGEFGFFYNHVRSHQNLGGCTPAETWADVEPFGTEHKDEYWFEGWDGLLTGYYLRR